MSDILGIDMRISGDGREDLGNLAIALDRLYCTARAKWDGREFYQTRTFTDDVMSVELHALPVVPE